MECCHDLITNPAFIYLYNQHLAVSAPLLPEIIKIVADYLIFQASTPVVITNSFNRINCWGIFSSLTKAKNVLNNIATIDEDCYLDYIKSNNNSTDVETPQQFFKEHSKFYQIHDLLSDIDINQPIYILSNLDYKVSVQHYSKRFTNSLDKLKSDYCFSPCSDWTGTAAQQLIEEHTITVNKFGHYG